RDGTGRRGRTDRGQHGGVDGGREAGARVNGRRGLRRAGRGGIGSRVRFRAHGARGRVRGGGGQHQGLDEDVPARRDLGGGADLGGGRVADARGGVRLAGADEAAGGRGRAGHVTGVTGRGHDADIPLG